VIDSSIHSGSGEDWVDITSNREAVSRSRIDTGTGDDTVFLRCSSGNHPDVYESEISLGEGDDYIDFGTSIDGYVDGGTGFDILRLRHAIREYSTVLQPDGWTLFTRAGDAFFSLRTRNIELVLYGDLVTPSVYAGSPLSGYLGGSPTASDNYYGRGIGAAIDSLQVSDSSGPDAVTAIGQGGYVSSGIFRSNFAFGDQPVTFTSSVLGGAYSRAAFLGSLRSGAGSTQVLLSAIEPDLRTSAITWYASGADNWEFDLGEGSDVINSTIEVNRTDGVRAYGMTGSSVALGGGDDSLLISVTNTSGYRYMWGLLDMPRVDLGTGNDVVSISSDGIGIEASHITTGDGDDFVGINAGLTALKNSSLYLGDGNDHAFLRVVDGSEPSTIDSLIDMGSGDDELLLTGGGARTLLNGGSGFDRLRLAATPEDYTVVTNGNGDLQVFYRNRCSCLASPVADFIFAAHVQVVFAAHAIHRGLHGDHFGELLITSHLQGHLGRPR
jgi:hypothetical protein